jgi:hypothetical protein
MTGGSTATFKMVLLYSLMISTILFHRVSSFLEVTLDEFKDMDHLYSKTVTFTIQLRAGDN